MEKRASDDSQGKRPSESRGGLAGDSDSTWVRQLGLFGVVVSTLAGYTCGAAGIGYLAWKKWGAPKWIIFPLCFAGLGLAMVRIYQLFKVEVNKS